MVSKGRLPKPFHDAVKSFDAWVDAELNEGQIADAVEKPLYQYTTAAGLKGIFETERLWFTDYRFHNDPDEFRYGKSLALEVLDPLEAAAPNLYVKDFVRSVRGILASDKLDTALDVFLACFSRKRDDLGQWRAYGDNGRGFAIGFAPQMFKIEDGDFKSHIEKIYLGSVVYDRAEALSRHQDAIDRALQTFMVAARSYPHLMKSGAIEDAFRRELRTSLIASPLIWYSLTAKHQAYRDEDEVRQVLLGSGDNLKPHIQTRVRGSEIVPYVAAPWGVRGAGMVAEIVVGPAASLGAEEAVFALLRSFGVSDVKVSRSEIPYRPV